MKKTITLFLITMLFVSCGVSIKSVVGSSVSDTSYKNTLIAIPYTRGSKKFSEKLKYKLEKEYKRDANKVEFILFEKEDYKLFLIADSDINKKIKKKITEDKKDLLIVFKSTNVSFMHNGLQSVHYEITGIDTENKKEVWKAEFDSNEGIGTNALALKTSKTIYKKLKSDQVYK